MNLWPIIIKCLETTRSITCNFRVDDVGGVFDIVSFNCEQLHWTVENGNPTEVPPPNPTETPVVSTTTEPEVSTTTEPEVTATQDWETNPPTDNPITIIEDTVAPVEEVTAPIMTRGE